MYQSRVWMVRRNAKHRGLSVCALQQNKKSKRQGQSMEEMVPIRGFEKEYGINSKGEVYSYRNKIWLKIIRNGDGYYQYGLCNKPKKRMCTRAKLIAEHFIDKPNGHPVVHHKDMNPSNDDINNLEWVTRSINAIKKMKKSKNYYFNKRDKNWHVQFRRNYILINIGRFKTEDEAKKVVLEYLLQEGTI